MRALPIDPFLPALVSDVRDRRGLVLVAEPGAGKTTRLPRALLDAGLDREGEIVVVQPRRIAARMAARRVAEELGEEVGERVGYRVRFEQRVGKRTRLTFVTEGILARRLDADPRLSGVAVVVFDELHERHLPTDLALARARRARERGREALSIVAMSATIDAEPVARFLDAPVREVPGRTHPVEVRFAESVDDRPLERRVRAAVVRLIEELPEPGDLLVFLPGAGEIRRASEELEGPAKALGFEVVPLHGDLPAEAQDRAVRPGPRRKVILSTNVAETSLTIEGVVAVVDGGLARVARSSPWTGLSSLDVLPISRASATQRAGRAGRTRPGVCVRLYTRADHDARPLRDRPEIERADLAEMVLSLRAAGEDPRTFPYLEAPPAAALDAAERLLERLGATDRAGVSALGRAMLELPLHPRLARVALEAHRQGHTRSGALLAALLAERDVRLAARARIGQATGTRSDEVGASDLLARMDELDAAGPSASSLRASGLDPRAAHAVREGARQIERALASVRLAGEPSFDEEAALLLATLAGFPDRLARRRRAGADELALASGGAAKLDASSVVKEATLLVAVDAESRAGGAWVRRASAVTVEMLMALDLERVEDVRAARFDAARERVVGVAELRYDGLVLETSELEASREEAARVLADAALAAGIERFVDGDALTALTRRLRFARILEPSLPELDPAWLRALLVRLAEGKRSFAELQGAGVFEWIRAELGGEVLARLEAIAPEAVALPGRRRVPVTYEEDRPPWIASRLADFFGLGEGPRVAGGRVPLVLHLLAPNHRALQVTTDLSGFWERHYPELRRALMRRYPRHPWPDDPRSASPAPPRR